VSCETPQNLFLENVPGLAFNGKSEASIDRDRAVTANAAPATSLVVAKLNAADYGVPQMRSVFVSAREGTLLFRPPLTPPPTPSAHFRPSGRTTQHMGRPGRSRPDFDSQLRVRGKWADLLPSIPEGTTTSGTPSAGGATLFGGAPPGPSCSSSPKQAVLTLQAQPGRRRPVSLDERRLPREALPHPDDSDSYNVLGSVGVVQKQIGTPSPAALAKVSRAIRRQILGDRVSDAPTLLPRGVFPCRPRKRPPCARNSGRRSTRPTRNGPGYGARRRSPYDFADARFVFQPSLLLARQTEHARTR
jgi:DNA (cytosine-5)-methyltransferase 1